jgi:hypothetical protein
MLSADLIATLQNQSAEYTRAETAFVEIRKDLQRVPRTGIISELLELNQEAINAVRRCAAMAQQGLALALNSGEIGAANKRPFTDGGIGSVQ